MGPTGAGKSTVSHHFDRLQMVLANSVEVNKQDLRPRTKADHGQPFS